MATRRIEEVFPTLIYRGSLDRCKTLNEQLEHDIAELIQSDQHGRSSSRASYSHGYTSYWSQPRLHTSHKSFQKLSKKMLSAAKDFVRELAWDMDPNNLVVVDCWANAMGVGGRHEWHNHRGSLLSGVYYINSPRGGAPFVAEDPRMSLFMRTPPKKDQSPKKRSEFVSLKPKAGDFLMFESWLRHEVPKNTGKIPRLSVAFNLG